MKITVHSKTGCPYCVKAKKLLRQYQLEFEVVTHDNDAERQEFYKSVGEGVKTVPQIFVDDERVGGYTELLQRIDELVVQNDSFNQTDF